MRIRVHHKTFFDRMKALLLFMGMSVITCLTWNGALRASATKTIYFSGLTSNKLENTHLMSSRHKSRSVWTRHKSAERARLGQSSRDSPVSWAFLLSFLNAYKKSHYTCPIAFCYFLFLLNDSNLNMK